MIEKLFKKKKKQIFILYTIVIFILFWMGHSRSLDPDFGWHLRMGEVILTDGIPLTDPFSFTMPSYPFVDHEWLSNVLLALIYANLGLSVTTVLFAGIAFASLFLVTVSSKKQWVILALLLSSSALVLYMGGVRLQVLSWFFASLLFLLFLNQTLWKKYRILLPLLFLAWVNLHGSFAFGIGLVGFFVFIKQIRAKHILWVDWIVVLSSVVITLVNPYGWRIWWEVSMQMTDGSLRWRIAEWLPAIFFMNIPFLVYMAISVSLFKLYFKKFSFLEQSLYVLLLLFGLSSARHLPFWLLFSLPLMARKIEYLYNEIKSDTYGRPRFWVAYGVMHGVAICICLFSFWMLWQGQKVSYTAAYPVEAVAYLNNNTPQKNIISPYGWGGYLIWKLPQKKVFIDGRMPSWRWDASLPGESNYIFEEERQFLKGEISLTTMANKYDVSTMLLSSERQLDEKKAWVMRLENKWFGSDILDPNYLHKEARKAGWVVVYKDERAVIYQDKSREGL